MDSVANTLSAEQLLRIPLTEPERLFAPGLREAELEFRRMASKWHPDRCTDPRANHVFAHVKALHEEAQRRLHNHTWNTPGLKRFTADDDRVFEIRYARRHEFELGEAYVGRTAVAYALPRAQADMMTQARRSFGQFVYADLRMREQIAPSLPTLPVAGLFETAEASVMVLSKSPEMLLLRDVLACCGDRMEARHVAWIISTALNLACYLQYAGLTHNAISPDTYFISPRLHGGALYGGWWYACRAGHRMRAAPERTLEYGPYNLMRNKIADSRTDLELIRAMGRELLGDVSGVRLTRDKAAPVAMIKWLRLPASADAVTEYQTWQRQVLKDSFGARRFTKLEISHGDIYSEGA